METVNRGPFQGLANIVRFNWHFFVIGVLTIASLISFSLLTPFRILRYPAIILASLTTTGIIVSLFVSWFVYDHSGLYEMKWLNTLCLPPRAVLLNIHAGYDECSALLAARYPEASLTVKDFYDPVKHTEVSIRRARRAYPAYPGTESISTADVVLQNSTADVIFLILAAHEIRDNEERKFFLQRLREALKPGGSIVLVEHLRDAPNFLAYNVGFFHFLSRRTWVRSFSDAQLAVTSSQKITPFISLYILAKNGTGH